MKRPKLLISPNHGMVIGENYIGLEKAEVELIDSLDQNGFSVGIVAVGENSRNTSLTGELRVNEYSIHDVGVSYKHRSRFFKIANYLYSCIRIPGITLQYENIYAFFPGNTSLLVCLWARILGRRYGLYVRCDWLRNGKTPFLYKQVFKGAHYMIVTGATFKEVLSIYTNKILTVVPFTPLRPSTDIPQRQLDKREVRLIFVGRICETKGVLDVVRALPNVEKSYPDIRLSIAGGGTQDELQALEKLAKELKVESLITIHGHVNTSQLETLYKEADIMVLPSYFSEGFPRVIYEAMMFALPIITCPMTGSQGFLIDTVNCYYCAPRNPTDLSQKILKMLDDRESALHMGIRNLETVKALYGNFTHTSHADQLVSFLKDANEHNNQFETQEVKAET